MKLLIAHKKNGLLIRILAQFSSKCAAADQHFIIIILKVSHELEYIVFDYVIKVYS